jgi:hypothetical protein
MDGCDACGALGGPPFLSIRRLNANGEIRDFIARVTHGIYRLAVDAPGMPGTLEAGGGVVAQLLPDPISGVPLPVR